MAQNEKGGLHMGLFDKFKKEKKQKTNAEIYIDYMIELFGGEPHDIHMADSEDGGRPVSVLFWHDLPEEGFMTAVTYGLSERDHPDWKNGKCELMLSLKTKDQDWGYAMAVFANSFGGEKSFTYGSVFTTDDPLSKESEMRGFFVFAPAILERNDAVLQMPDYKIFLNGMYPIYKEEIAVFNEIGLKEFWHHENFKMYDVNRKRIGGE